jgi:hypothetical protein
MLNLRDLSANQGKFTSISILSTILIKDRLVKTIIPAGPPIKASLATSRRVRALIPSAENRDGIWSVPVEIPIDDHGRDALQIIALRPAADSQVETGIVDGVENAVDGGVEGDLLLEADVHDTACRRNATTGSSVESRADAMAEH